MRVLKFGGTSVATAASITQVCDIVAARAAGGERLVVVVSALGGVTDELVALSDAATRGAVDPARLTALRSRHEEAARALCSDADLPAVLETIARGMDDLGRWLQGITLVGERTARTLDQVLATGELQSSPLVSAALRHRGVDSAAVDARSMIVTDARHGNAVVQADATRAGIVRVLGGRDDVPVVTGFIAATEAGQTTTLGRGGSDTTAALVAAALRAEAVELWTDVDGVMSADPRIVREAVPLPELSYEELMELSHFGAKVVHPPTVHPARAGGIPLWIKNTFRPGAPGTLVQNDDPSRARASGPVCGITSIPGICLLRLEGDGMVGVPGIAGRLFAALARREVSVILISQASSEHSICFAIRPADVAAATAAADEEFAAERAADMVAGLVVEHDLSVVAVVGAGMRERPGIAGRVFGVLGSRDINVHAIAQGSSELNVSLVVAHRDTDRAVHALHDAFFLSGWRDAHLLVAGVGGVGRVLLRQLHARAADLQRSAGIRLVLRGVCNSTGCALDEAGLDPATAADAPRTATELVPLSTAIDQLAGGRRSRRIFVDMTASDTTGDAYGALLAAGVSVVTANKRRLAQAQASYDQLLATGPGTLYYETTVGAGLPVIQTLQGLLATGDRLRGLDGVLSGTGSALTQALRTGTPFSDAVGDAHRQGFTEPDPREDLNGMDVARKLLIVGRLAGLRLEPQDIEVTPWLPDGSWDGLSLEEFWARLPELDADFATRQAAAQSRGGRLEYLARLQGGKAAVDLVVIEPDHPCWELRPGENLVAFTTDRYAAQPLVVRGPGAGPEVTAAGVFADILRAIAEDDGDRRWS